MFNYKILFICRYSKGKLNASRVFSIENDSRMYRSSSTPSTVDTAYSSMKPSPRAMGSEDDYPIDTFEINVASIENDAISVINGGVSVSPTTSSTYDDTIETSTECVSFYNVVIECAHKVFADQLRGVFESDSFKISISNIWKVHFPTMPRKLSRKRSARAAMSSVFETETRSITPTTSKIGSRKRTADTALESAPRAKRERRLLSTPFDVHSIISPSPVPSEAVDPNIVLQRTKEREEKLRERISGCIIKNCPSTILFRGLDKGPVCNVCRRTGNVSRCIGPCQLYFHADCMDADNVEPPTKKIRHVTGDGVYEDELVVNNTGDSANICCVNCRDGKEMPKICFVCNKGSDIADELVCCAEKQCFKYYHHACLQYWPQSRFNVNNGAFLCPYHVCQTCQSN